MALERMKVCPNISELAKELEVPRVRLYQWSKEQEPGVLPETLRPEAWKGRGKNDQEKVKLAEHLQQVKQLLAEKTMEVDFLKGALQRIAVRRQENGSNGGTQSTRKSSK